MTVEATFKQKSFKQKSFKRKELPKNLRDSGKKNSGKKSAQKAAQRSAHQPLHKAPRNFAQKFTRQTARLPVRKAAQTAPVGLSPRAASERFAAPQQTPMLGGVAAEQQEGITQQPSKHIAERSVSGRSARSYNALADTPAKLSGSAGSSVLLASNRAVTPRALPAKTPSPVASSLSLNVLKTVNVGAGLCYKYILVAPRDHAVHLLEVDRSVPDVAVEVVKAEQRYNGLEKLTELARLARCQMPEVVGLVNANLWRAYSNTPIGPTVSGGEPIELSMHKRWSSCFFDREHRMYIDSFSLHATVRIRGDVLPIAWLNRRSHTEGVALYNRYIGSTVPFSASLDVEEIEQQARANAAREGDSTEADISTKEVRRIVEEYRRFNALELPLKKVVAVYLKPPVINEDIPCKVIAVQRGVVAVPQNGIVLSLDDSVRSVPLVGERFTLRVATNVWCDVPFVQAVSGTPRLVRHGVALHEAEQEGVTSNRFVYNRLPRTAVGTNASGSVLLFAVIEGVQRGRSPATLAELAECMRALGAHEALNLDGGGSTGMVLGAGGEVSVLYGSIRKVSVALAVRTREQIPEQDMMQSIPISDAKPAKRSSSSLPAKPARRVR
jgi:hypothetical protein